MDNNADKVQTDFDIACMRAKVDKKSAESYDEGHPNLKLRMPAESGTKSQTSGTSQEVTDDLIIELAKKDLVNIMKLNVGGF